MQRTVKETIQLNKAVWIKFDSSDLSLLSKEEPALLSKKVGERGGLNDFIRGRLNLPQKIKKISELKKINSLIKERGITKEALLKLLEKYKKVTQK